MRLRVLFVFVFVAFATTASRRATAQFISPPRTVFRPTCLTESEVSTTIPTTCTYAPRHLERRSCDSSDSTGSRLRSAKPSAFGSHRLGPRERLCTKYHPGDAWIGLTDRVFGTGPVGQNVPIPTSGNPEPIASSEGSWYWTATYEPRVAWPPLPVALNTVSYKNNWTGSTDRWSRCRLHQ